MLEKTIIFVSEDVQKCSSAVLAMKALIKPFSICHSVIPVLPGALIDYLGAPVPLLVGITKRQLRDNEVEMVDNTPISWVDLDDSENHIWSKIDDDFQMPYFEGLND
jgi:hypothetical protein